jgi:hypothetical protein
MGSGECSAERFESTDGFGTDDFEASQADADGISSD